MRITEASIAKFVFSYSKIQLQRELDNSRIHCRRGDHTKGRVRDVRTWVAELRRVERIEKLCPEFDTCAFTQGTDRRALAKNDVEVPLVRSEHDTHAAVAE